jgi:hypothetical protein
MTSFKVCVNSKVRFWDTRTGSLIRAAAGHLRYIKSAAFSSNGKLAVTGGDDGTIRLGEAATGRPVRVLVGHSTTVQSVAFSTDDKLILSGSEDGTFRAWNVQTGKELVMTLDLQSREWLRITPAGSFASSPRGADGLVAVRGLEITTLPQLHQSLFSPDLVSEALLGDPDGEIERAGAVINLDKVVDSGPAPVVEISVPSPGGRSDAQLVEIKARIKDSGKGIGRIEWRVNGITAAVAYAPAGAGRIYEPTQTIALDPGDNIVEVVAYNGNNLLASLPASTTIAFVGSREDEKPRLHILAIGINAYVDEGSTPRGAKEAEYFPKLNLAVNDATTFANEIKKAASGLYGDVQVRTVLDGEATAAGLEQTFAEKAAEIHPADTFVLFAAAHGTSSNGHFYLIPQDYQGGTNPDALAKRAIGQDLLQKWIANRIKAKKALILLDTCESGALVGDYARSRVGVPSSEAAMGRLHEATGRPVLTAAASGKPAFEGYKGRGVFTWALIDALYHGDGNNNGVIELSELVTHVQATVPRIAEELNGVARAAVAARGGSEGSQSARFGSKGEDYPIVRLLR